MIARLLHRLGWCRGRCARCRAYDRVLALLRADADAQWAEREAALGPVVALRTPTGIQPLARLPFVPFTHAFTGRPR